MIYRASGSSPGLASLLVDLLVPGLNEAQVLDVSSQKESSERQSDG